METVLLDKIKRLPEDKQQEVQDFIDYLLQKYQQPDAKTKEEIAEKRRSNMGRLKGQIWMAEDFNDTPEDFKDYM